MLYYLPGSWVLLRLGVRVDQFRRKYICCMSLVLVIDFDHLCCIEVAVLNIDRSALQLNRSKER
jgi:hypothetical protein